MPLGDAMVAMSDIRDKRDAILRLAERHGARNVRIFGSVVRDEANATSDVDLLIELDPDRSLLDRIALMHDLEDLLGCKVDVVNQNALHWTVRDRILTEGVSL